MEPHDFDALAQAEDILSMANVDLAAEITKAHAEMTLLTAVARKSNMLASFMHKASQQSDDYLTGMMIAIGLTARNWGRILGDAASMDFTEYINPEAGAVCEDEFAHYLVREILLVTTIPQADKLRVEMKDWMQANGAENFARICIHTVGMYSELIRDILDIRNGDFPG